MLVREPRERPQRWTDRRQSIRRQWTIPLYGIEWIFQWVAYFLCRSAFLETLDYLGALSVLFGVVFYISEAGDRLKQKHYQAWQVINTAQGKGGSGGRIEALQELNADGVQLTGVDVSGAYIRGIRLPQASLARADFEAVDARDSVFARSNLEFANLRSANFRQGDLSRADLRHADLEDTDLVSATLAGANLTETNLKNADLRNCDLGRIAWQGIKAIDSANVYGVRNAPDGFLAWARQHGAISVPSAESK
jgi:hypothetical protein